MVYDFPYLKDSAFLKRFDQLKIKQQLVKIVVLNFNQEPIQQIQGKVTGGNLSLDGSSAMRRTGNVNLIADQYENDLTTTRNLLSINKKIELLVGFINTTGEYTNYDVLWFPQGIYMIINPSISHSGDGINISLTLHDKMANLNGECGGTLPASVVFDTVEDIDEQGNIVLTRPPIFQIIQQVVHHFGNEQIGKILISDIDNQIKQTVRWTGATPLYLLSLPSQDQGVTYTFDTNYFTLAQAAQNAGYLPADTIMPFNYGQDVGYIYTDFVYPNELISNAGDTVVTILDQIRDTLGNYQYFYDINGNFIFRQIKNYLNKSYSTVLLNETNMQDYLVDYTTGKSVYEFNDGNLITSYSNSPQYQQIKNDFIIWGKKKTITGQELPIRYHLAIDRKPKVGNTYDVFFFTDPDDGITKAKRPLKFSSHTPPNDTFPTKGQTGLYYLAQDTGIIYKWDNDPQIQNYQQTPYSIEQVTTADWRTELYMRGVDNQPLGLDSNYYFPELKNEWTKIYDIKGNTRQDNLPGFRTQIEDDPSQVDYFLDFIDSPTAIDQFSVENIGRRTTVLVDDTINCIFMPDHPDIVLLQSAARDISQQRNRCEERKQEYSQVEQNIYSMLMIGGALKPAVDQIRRQLYQYTNYNEQVSINVLPIYYLEPNLRITIKDIASGINGDYIIKNINLPLDINSTMSISCTKAVERA